ncbi:MAG: hypothetical protein ACLUI3_16560 [Christensenellales bacterium]
MRANVWQRCAAAAGSLAASNLSVLFILWFGAKMCWGRLARVGYRGVYDLPLLLYEDGGEILQGGEAVQRGAARGGFVEAHQADDENAAGASSRWRFRRRSAWRSAAFPFAMTAARRF